MALLAAVLTLTLLLGVATLAIDRSRAGAQRIDPLGAERATNEVVDAAAEVVAAAGLADAAGATALNSCTNADQPPYEAAVTMTFAVPEGNSVA